jgi:hypothetical protein
VWCKDQNFDVRRSSGFQSGVEKFEDGFGMQTCMRRSREGKAEVAGMEKRGDDGRVGGFMRLVDGGADDLRLDKSIGIILQGGT